ncbi:cytosolic phospholipase A2 gamma [Haliaeetus albicilla]|uniref:cytosolic phospholipase A2 gamma n=1 Tax=Haliaeetus albicilla TaxID=8969 RepID=UPI0037E79D86
MATKDDNEVRLSDSLSEGEIKATQKRKEKVLMCLKNLGIHCDQNNVPNIVVLGSGGGLRAMIALLGTLVELKKQNFLDAVMYLCGVSGSTWCMSLLYGDGKWSENLMYLEKELCKNLSNFSWHIRKAIKSLEESSKDEHYSLTDFWASCLVYQILQQFDENELADHREASETGINPYPIYAAVDKEKLNEEGVNFPGTWFEFTPHEVGYTALGAFVSTKLFGSEFENGKLKKRGKKKHICYMQGLWGSALGSIEEILKFIRDSLALFLQRSVYSDEDMFSHRLGSSLGNFTVYEASLLLLDLQLCAVSGSDPTEVFKKLLNIWSDKEKSASYQLCIEMCNTWAMKNKKERMESCAELAKEIEKEFGVFLGEEGTLEGVLPPHSEILLGSVWGVSKMVLKTIQCALTWKWGTTNNFLYNCPNFQSSYLVKTKLISLIDAGLAINSAYPLVLRAKRRADLIISFDFSSGDPFETIKKTATYCQKNGIAFPKIEDQEMDKENPSECYIFQGDKSCPTVMHFPLFNNANCSGNTYSMQLHLCIFAFHILHPQCHAFQTPSLLSAAATNGHRRKGTGQPLCIMDRSLHGH